MDDRLAAAARECLDAAYKNTMSFPEIVGTLTGLGFEGYIVDYGRNTTTYFLPNGESVMHETPPSAEGVAAIFDASGVAAQIKWAQSNQSDYSYKAFCKNVKACGCAGYIVSFLGRRVVYFGRTAETHVEHFPQ